jgi:hypothetical protein
MNMKSTYAVLHMGKSAFDEQEVGLNIDTKPGSVVNGGTLSFYIFGDRELAHRKAKECATVSTVGLVFEMTEAFIIRPTPVEIISVRGCPCGKGDCGSCGS